MADYIRREANGDDYVRRADIIEKFMDRLPSISVNYLCKIADEVPPADVRPVVHGSWRAVSFHEVSCTKCGYVVDIMKADVDHMKFCNECGADMRPEPPEREVGA